MRCVPENGKSQLDSRHYWTEYDDREKEAYYFFVIINLNNMNEEKKWWILPGSNQRPKVYETSALTTELRIHKKNARTGNDAAGRILIK